MHACFTIRKNLAVYFRTTPTRKSVSDRVYIMLLLRADQYGRAWPKLKILAKECHVHVRRVKEALAKLIALGYINACVVENPNKKGEMIVGWRILNNIEPTPSITPGTSHDLPENCSIKNVVDLNTPVPNCQPDIDNDLEKIKLEAGIEFDAKYVDPIAIGSKPDENFSTTREKRSYDDQIALSRNRREVARFQYIKNVMEATRGRDQCPRRG